ncbi:MAG: STAS domain-containing protein [Gammaproteobacteria bacterium]|nr:STAS domain-containing protein [Gammaproteobacteria bacterium]
MTALYSLSTDDNGAINVSGELTFNTVSQIVTVASGLFEKLSNLEIDLVNVTRSDSAGLALLVDWVRYAKNTNKNIVFHHMPEQLLALAYASGLDELLPVN